MASCAGRLHQLQRDVGLTDDELKQAVKEVSRPREVELPRFHEKIPVKELQAEREKNSKAYKQRRYEVVYWYLEEYLKPEYARQIYLEHPDFKELVSYVYELALDLIQLNTFVRGEIEDPLEIFPEDPETEFDIPDIHWKAFSEYCEKHPLKSVSDIPLRREKFKSHMEKKRKTYYSAKRMRMYDPIFALNAVNEKEMVKNLERITKENELRVREFKKMLDSLVEDKSIGAVAMAKFDQTTKALLDTQKKRLKSFMKECKQPSTPVILDIDDEPSVRFD